MASNQLAGGEFSKRQVDWWRGVSGRRVDRLSEAELTTEDTEARGGWARDGDGSEASLLGGAGSLRVRGEVKAAWAEAWSEGASTGERKGREEG